MDNNHNKQLGPGFMKLEDVLKHCPGFSVKQPYMLEGNDVEVFVLKTEVDKYVNDARKFRTLETIIVTFIPYLNKYSPIKTSVFA